MNTRMISLLVALMAFASSGGETLTIRGGGGEVTVDARYGDILASKGQPLHSDAKGLWSIVFKSGTRLSASEFRDHPDWFVAREGTKFTFREGFAEVVVEFVGGPDGVDIRGSVTARKDDPAMTFELPARLRFDPTCVDRFYMPQRGNGGLGMALKRSFFEETSSLKCPAWKQVGPHPWKRNPVAERDAKVARELPEAVAASDRAKAGFIHFRCGPFWGSLSKGPTECRRMVDSHLKGKNVTVVDIGSHEELLAALKDDTFRFIFDCYGDLVPMRTADDIQPTVAAIRDYVSRGGRWVSPVDYELITAYVPGGYYSYEFAYPNLFMDFCQLKTVADGSVTVYGVRPRPPHVPWKNPRENHFVPGSLGCGGGGRGGYLDRDFKIYGKKGEPFAVPAVRFAFAQSLDDAIRGYAKANDLEKPMAAKAPAKLIETMKKSAIVTIYGSPAARCAEVAEMLPAPAVIHISSYLKGGFDKEYPDHLPSNAWFGGDEGHRALIERVRRRGHLYMPYTNPTWWCDHPRGPTFAAAGEEPLLVNLDGTHFHEVYKQDGWTSCFWHPAVIAANRKTVTQFLTDLPVDILFQDQCGARRFKYDLNPSAPSPVSYTEGLLSQLEDDAARVPLGTEDGWDKVANEELGVFGVSWATIPRHLDFHKRDYQVLQKEYVSPETWEIEPLAMRLMHEKCMFYCHDLSGSVFCERLVPWYMALGYNLSYDASEHRYRKRTTAHPWDRYIAALQKHVVSNIAGQPLGKFRHDRAPLLARDDIAATDRADDGVVIASWGAVRCVANLGDVQREVAKGVVLAPYGYVVEGPGFRAEYLASSHPVISAVGLADELVKDDDGKVVFETRSRR